MHHVFVFDGLTRLGVDAIARQDDAVVAKQLAVFVIRQTIAVSFIERLEALSRLHGHHVGGAIDLTAQFGVDQSVERPVFIGSPQVDTARHQRRAVANRHAVVGLQVGGTSFVQQRQGFAVFIVERANDRAVGHGVFIDIVPSVDGAVLLPFFHGDGGTIGTPNLGKQVHIGTRQVDDLVLVAGKVQAHLNAVVFALGDVVGQDGLDTLVGHHTRVDGHVVGTRRRSQR